MVIETDLRQSEENNKALRATAAEDKKQIDTVRFGVCCVVLRHYINEYDPLVFLS